MTQTSLQEVGDENNLVTGFLSPGGAMDSLVTTENQMQVKITDSVTAKNLFVRADNVTGSAATVRSRKNGANGNLVVSITSSSGDFEDTLDSDSLVSGDLYCFGYTKASSNNYIGALGCTLDESSTTTSYMVDSDPADFSMSSNAHNFAPLCGRPSATEAYAVTKYLFRYATTLGPMGVFVSANTYNQPTSVIVNQNGGTAATISVTASTTGMFTSVSTVAVASGDTVGWDVFPGAGGAGTITVTLLFMQNKSSARLYSIENAYTGAGSFLQGINNNFVGIAGDLTPLTIETDIQMKLRGGAVTAKLMLTDDDTNTLNGSTFVSLRVGAVTSALKVSIGAAATGILEDNVDTVSLVNGNRINCLVDTSGSSSGAIGLHQLGISYLTPAGTDNTLYLA